MTGPDRTRTDSALRINDRILRLYWIFTFRSIVFLFLSLERAGQATSNRTEPITK